MTYKYPKSLWVIAEEIADWRTTLNKSNRSNNPRFDRGEKNNYVDVLGVVGELIVLDYLTEKNNMTYKYPKSLWVIAKEIADWRTTLNKSNRSNNPRFDRGEKNNYVDV